MSLPTEERDTQLLSIGQQCSDPSCALIDFLPFKCQHCAEPFCGEHFPVAAHKCSKYDENKYNRVAPSCPLCNVPVAVRPGQDPNVRMEQHITTDCSVMTGKSGKSKSLPVCARAKCKKVLFAPIRCDKCRAQFCPQHRFPADHNCAASATSSTSKPSPALKPQSNPSSKASTAGTTTMSALRNALASASLQSTPHPAAAPKPSITPSNPTATHTNPFSMSDRPLSANPSPTSSNPSPNKHKIFVSFVPPPIFASV